MREHRADGAGNDSFRVESSPIFSDFDLATGKLADDHSWRHVGK
jgi:hypothetical protein